MFSVELAIAISTTIQKEGHEALQTGEGGKAEAVIWVHEKAIKES